MLVLLQFFAATIAVLIHLKLKRTWVKFLVGALGGFFGSIVLGVVLALILESTGNPQLGKDIGLVGLKSCLGTSIVTIIFLFIVPFVLKRWKGDAKNLFQVLALVTIGIALTIIIPALSSREQLAENIIIPTHQVANKTISTHQNETWGENDKIVSSSSTDFGENDQVVQLTKQKQGTQFDPSTAVMTSKPNLESQGWTQENTNSQDVGPWLQYSPRGTRYCRLADRTIVRVYPPGVVPNAEKANPFCLDSSTETVPP